MAAALYILLGIASFALIAFFAWATWKGGKTETPDPDAGPPSTASREAPPRGPAGRV